MHKISYVYPCIYTKYLGVDNNLKSVGVDIRYTYKYLGVTNISLRGIGIHKHPEENFPSFMNLRMYLAWNNETHFSFLHNRWSNIYLMQEAILVFPFVKYNAK